MSEKEASPHPLHRRDALKIGAAAAAGFLTRDVAADVAKEAPATAFAGPYNPRTAGAMPTRNFGRTGFRVGIFSLGGQAAVEKPDSEAAAVPILEKALDLGVNYIDTSARYGGDARWSERYIGKVMKRRRSEAFLATKTHDRTRDGAWKLLETSLELLNTDHVDLWQIHNLTSKEQVDRIFAPGGAVKAMQEARDQKLVRFLGVTGHADPDVLLEAIRRFPFDTVLMALNAADPHHRSFQKELLPAAVEKEMGIVGMKIPARGRILSSWTPPPAASQPAW
ncbi:MAG: aldo/keto reductase, partial [Thermoanaerobaculia bacterium]|nr:aldo/keto reductase [Thermoanaerobaculia bacterium]